MRVLFVLCITVLVFLTGCSNNSSDPVETGGDPPSLPPNMVLTTPATSPVKVQTYGQIVSGFMAQNFGSLGFFAGLNPSENNGVWTWNLAIGSLSIATTAQAEGDDNYHWRVYFNGSDGQSDYDNWLAFESLSNKDGTTGSMQMYAPNTPNIVYNFNWDVDQVQNIAVVYNSVLETQTISFSNLSDDSGSIEVENDGTTLIFESSWDVVGSGWWKEYDLYGALLEEGTW